MSNEERAAVIEEIKGYLRQLGLVAKEETSHTHETSASYRQTSDSE